jgi:AraC-like DNA-binding protein
MFCGLLLMENSENHKTPGDSDASKAVSKAASIIDENLHLPINVPDIARRVGLSQNYLARLFKKRYGVALTRYQMLKRMELARYLLLSSDIKIKEIGARCGLPDPQHFNKYFKKSEGKSPSSFRKLNL